MVHGFANVRMAFVVVFAFVSPPSPNNTTSESTGHTMVRGSVLQVPDGPAVQTYVDTFVLAHFCISYDYI